MEKLFDVPYIMTDSKGNEQRSGNLPVQAGNEDEAFENAEKYLKAAYPNMNIYIGNESINE